MTSGYTETPVNATIYTHANWLLRLHDFCDAPEAPIEEDYYKS
jgi:hypothetical protein